MVPLRFRLALIAVSLSSYSQKPYPLARPVFESYKSRNETTVPTCEKTSRSSSSVVSYEMFPTKTVVPGGRPCPMLMSMTVMWQKCGLGVALEMRGKRLRKPDKDLEKRD